ncbi:enterobactin transporter EntS [Nocardioides humi]|uniref:enterobactin transporter EntS n=1 Tax=Nocardioides humi TaxID=449461 RepID=UPI0015E85668|nr:enterobactin transporter EntS [Nocardioides humi]
MLRGLVDWSALAIDLRPLRENRQFRLLFTGRLVSLAGLGMLMVVFSWQIYELTGSSLQVALVNATLGVAAFAGSLVGGVQADRADRRRLIVWSRTAAVLGFVALAVNASLPEPSVAVLYVVALWDGVAGGFSSTALAAAVPAVLTRRQIPASGALMAISIDVGSVVAPLLAGVLLAVGSAALVYWVVVAVSLLSLVFLLGLRPIVPTADESGPDDSAGLWPDLVAGVRYAAGDRIVGGVLLLGFVQILFASPYVLIPEFITDDLGGGPTALGLVYSAPAAGALVATLLSGWTGRVRRIGRVQFIVFTAACLAVAGFGAAPALWVAVVAMAVVGAMDVLAEVVRFTILSERTPDHLRGRVASLWSAQGTVGETLGGPALSLLARPLGAGGAIAAGGLIGAAATAALWAGLAPLRTLTREPDDFDEPDEVDEAAAGIPAETTMEEMPR